MFAVCIMFFSVVVGGCVLHCVSWFSFNTYLRIHTYNIYNYNIHTIYTVVINVLSAFWQSTDDAEKTTPYILGNIYSSLHVRTIVKSVTKKIIEGSVGKAATGIERL